MPTKTETETGTSWFTHWHSAQKDASGLYELSQSTVYHEQFDRLTDSDKDLVKKEFYARLNVLRGRIKISELDGQVVTINSATYFESEYGPTVLLTGVRENGVEFEAWAQATAFMRTFTNPAILRTLPQKFLFHKVNRPEGRTMWKVQQMTGAKFSTSNFPWSN